MKKQKHQKHTNLNKPNFGFFGRNEWAVIGTTCGNIQQLANAITKNLATTHKVSYVDADHQEADAAPTEKKNAIDFGTHLTYTDKINYHRFDTLAKLDSYQFRQFFNESDIVLVNGNHFEAKKQIVVIDPKKEKSLAKKLDRLTDVRLLLVMDSNPIIPDYLKEKLPNLKSIPRYLFSETTKIIDFLKNDLVENVPPLYGLVLAGGKSQRMGKDKGLIDYHGQPQRLHIANILNRLCEKTFLSVRSLEHQPEATYPYIADTFYDLGPFGAIASAFRQHPNAAWLVVACDLPLLDYDTLNFLVDRRKTASIATAFNSPVNPFPEPLICIWEPKSYPILMQFLTQGYSCPRKVLINSDVHLLDAPNGEKLKNVNHPEELEAVLKILS